MHLRSNAIRLYPSRLFRRRWQAGTLSGALLVASVLGMLAPSDVGAVDGNAHEPVSQANSGPGLDGFLDAAGHLQLPKGFSGSLDPTGFRLVSGEGEALRFAPEPAKGGASPDGVWTGFGGIGNGCNGSVLAIAFGGAGEVYVGGDFSVCGAATANRVARFDITTQTFASLGSGATNGVSGSVRALAVSGSSLYVGGVFTRAGNAGANNVARFNTTTQTWVTLGSGAANGVASPVAALAVSGLSVFVGGSFTQAGGANANYVARFDTSTQTWAPLGNGLDDSVTAVAVSGNGVYVGGTFTQAGGALASRVARFDTLTQAWTSLGTGAANGVASSGLVSALAVSGSSLYVGGTFTQAGGATANRVARFDTTAQTWASLGSGAANGVSISRVFALAVSGNSLYVGGDFAFAGGATANRVARFDATTQAWASLGSGAANGVRGSFASVTALAVSGSSVYVGGPFSQAGVSPTNNVARFVTTTQSWATLGSGVGNGMNDGVKALAGIGNSLYAGGSFTQAGGVAAGKVARLNTTNQTWANLPSGVSNGVNGLVFALAVSGSFVYVGGDFTFAEGNLALRIARFDTTNQTWTSLGSGAANGLNDDVYALAVSGNSVYAGGRFTEAGGAMANRVARFDTTTQTWAPLGNGVNDTVEALAVSGNNVYVGGRFNQAGGATTANRVARFDTTTLTWASLGNGAANGVSNSVFALAVSGSSLYVGGFFSQAGGAAALRVARFDTTTQTWASLGTGAANGVSSAVVALVVSGTDLYVGGSFALAGGAAANNVARFDTATQTWESLGIGAANGVNGFVFGLSTFAGGILHVGGSFGSAGGQVSSNIASYTPEVIFSNGFE